MQVNRHKKGRNARGRQERRDEGHEEVGKEERRDAGGGGSMGLNPASNANHRKICLYLHQPVAAPVHNSADDVDVVGVVTLEVILGVGRQVDHPLSGKHLQVGLKILKWYSRLINEKRESLRILTRSFGIFLPDQKNFRSRSDYLFCLIFYLI